MIRVVNPSRRSKDDVVVDSPEAMKKVVASRILLISPGTQRSEEMAKIRSPGRPYLGTAAMALFFVESHDPSCTTAGVDSSWRMYFNAEFVLKSDIEAMAAVMEHEIWHLLRRHGRRAEKLGVPRWAHDIWNIAADCETHNDNMIYERIKKGTPITPVRAEDIGAISGMLAEDYYRFLMEKAEIEEHETYTKVTIKPPKTDDDDQHDGDVGGGQGEGEGEGEDEDEGGEGHGAGDEDEEGEGGEEGGSGGGSGEDEEGGGEGAGRSGGGMGPITIYIPKEGFEPGDIEEGQGPGGGKTIIYTPSGSCATNMPNPWELPPTDEHVSRSRSENIIRDTSKKIARSAALGRGMQPSGEAMTWAESELNPKVDWRDELRSQVSNAVAYMAGSTEFSRRRMSRRQAASPEYMLPGMQHPQIEIAIIIDVSGSMYSLFHEGSGESHNKAVSDCNLLEQAIAETREIVDQFGGGVGVQIFATDTAVKWAERVYSADQIQVPAEAGGTDIVVGMNAAYFAQPQPNVMVVLTDGATSWLNERGEEISNPPGIEVVVGIIGSNEEQLKAAGWGVPSWARIVYIT